MTIAKDDLIALLPGMPDPVLQRLARHATRRRVAAGAEVFAPGKPAENLLLLVSGTLRVQKLAETGREIVLYRVHAGESCILTTACLLTHEEYAASGVAETDLEVVSIPRDDFDALMASSAEFRGLIFQAYSRRITDLLGVIEEVAFRRVDLRLAAKLIERADAGDRVVITHHDLATELGSAREVVSRQLQEFQRRGWVTLGRGEVVLRDRAALKRFAQAADPHLV